MYTKKNAIETAENFVLDCIKSGIHIDKALLFGSYAKGKQHKFSDIDIALISKQFTLNFLHNNKLTSKINIYYPDIEVHHFNTEYFNSGDPFIYEINTNGYELKLEIT
ncbi:MAG: nucleotidyltransferase domain-containing protein [Bacteroidota bacterium]|nr:nucleotidyltransferase domain-containing protein [Bacteroidota bacterium]